MSEQQRALDDAFLAAALEEVTRAAPHQKAQTPLPPASRWPVLRVAAALLLGISAVVAVQMLSGDDTKTVTPAQDRAPEYGPVIHPRDAKHARELLSQVHAISMDVRKLHPSRRLLPVDPWQTDSHVVFTTPDDDVSAICALFAEGIDKALPLGEAVNERNQISLHLPQGRLICSYNLGLQQGVRLWGFGAWQPAEELKTWIADRERSAHEQAKRQLGHVTPADIEEDAAWLAELTTVRAVGLRDEHMAPLLAIRGLHTLDLSQSDMTIDSLGRLQYLRSLRVIVLDGWRSYQLHDGRTPTPKTEAERAEHDSRNWLALGEALAACLKLEVISLRKSEVRRSLLLDPTDPTPLADRWPNLQLLDLAGSGSDMGYAEFARLHAALPHALVSLPRLHVAGDLRLQHPAYEPSSKHAPRILRAVVEFAKERGLAIASVDVQRNQQPDFTASDGSRGTACKLGPNSRILRQGRKDFRWEIQVGQAVNLFPATDLDRVILLHNKGANWIAHDDRTERLVTEFLR